jgi:hypothetical protein
MRCEVNKVTVLYNSFLLMLTSISEIRKKSHVTKSWEQEGCAMTFVARDSPDRQSRLSRCIVMVEIPYMPDSTLHCTFSCRCHVSKSTVSLGFAFSKQMHNSANTENPMSVLITFKQTCLIFCGLGDDGLFH